MEWDFEIIFVDDGSKDGTTAIVESYCSSNSRVRILNLPKGFGKGGSITHAILTETLKDCVAFMDVDLSAEPSELERLLEHIEDYDLVLGSRILRDGLKPIERPFYRSFLSNSYSRLFRILFRLPIYDPQCGFKLFRTNVIQRLFGNITTMGFAFDTDLIVTAFAQGLRLKEVPINWTHGSFSKISILHEVQAMGSDLFSIWYRFHLSGTQNKLSYPQKRYSFYGRLLFYILSLNSGIKTRSGNSLNAIKLGNMDTTLS
jgi:glycosyltransferase involved in cell wall biosynthesis